MDFSLPFFPDQKDFFRRFFARKKQLYFPIFVGLKIGKRSTSACQLNRRTKENIFLIIKQRPQEIFPLKYSCMSPMLFLCLTMQSERHIFTPKATHFKVVYRVENKIVYPC